MYINKAFLYGNLTRDPEIKALPSGVKIASFSLATSRSWKDKATNQKKESTDFHNIVMFEERLVSLASQYLKKGKPIFVEGRIQNRSWEQDGVKKYRSEIVAEKIEFGPTLTPVNGGEGNGYQSQVGQDSKTQSSSPRPKEKEMDTIQYPDEEVNLEDIPF